MLPSRRTAKQLPPRARELELGSHRGSRPRAAPARPRPTSAPQADLVNSLKGVSSRRLRQEYPELVRHYWRAQRLWSGSYFAGSAGGAPLPAVRQYIEQRNRPM
ncbi:transposase [Streptomyces sp. NPDC002730]|uniref:transposase n=1 Tax=Streptomyces sp. NPDC002730 TaxID=3364662 RepID=UPI0036A7773D